MDTIKLPFQIGEQYEDWEFELDILLDRIKGYDSYKYIGEEVKFFLNYLPDEIELIFNLDILECVLLVFKDLTEEQLENLKISVKNEEGVKLILKSNTVYLIYGLTDLKVRLANSL